MASLPCVFVHEPLDLQDDQMLCHTHNICVVSLLCGLSCALSVLSIHQTPYYKCDTGSLSPVWMIICLFKSAHWLNALLHKWHFCAKKHWSNLQIVCHKHIQWLLSSMSSPVTGQILFTSKIFATFCTLVFTSVQIHMKRQAICDEKCISQSLQEYNFFLICSLLCLVKFVFIVNCLSDTELKYCLSSCSCSMWSVLSAAVF